MRKIIFLVFLVFNLSLQAQDVVIKSLKTYNSTDQASFPLLVFDEDIEPTITIEFDVEADAQPDLSIVFKFCDKDWGPYDNAFLENSGYNTVYNLWYDVLPVTANGAAFHYKGEFPNFDVTFPFSGKWIYYILDSFDSNRLYAIGKFIVVKPEIEVNASIENEKLLKAASYSSPSSRVHNITVDFDLAEDMFSTSIEEVEIIENNKIEYSIVIPKDSFGLLRYYEYNGASGYSFTARDIKPGNEYRAADLRDKNRFSPPTTKAQYDGIETSRYYMQGQADLNGGSRLVKFNDNYAEYMIVNFQLRPPENVDGKIFLTGAFNNWQVLPQYEMYDEDGLFDISVELKRGVYDYQYVTAEMDDDQISNIDWVILEGNYWGTRNIYNIFVYYKDENFGGYDKIIGYKQIYSGDL